MFSLAKACSFVLIQDQCDILTEKLSLQLENFCMLLLSGISSTEIDMHVMQSKQMSSVFGKQYMYTSA